MGTFIQRPPFDWSCHLVVRERAEEEGISSQARRQKHGPATWWYENGQKMREKNYKDGKLDGLFIVWNEKGKEIRRETYKDGEIVKD